MSSAVWPEDFLDISYIKKAIPEKGFSYKFNEDQLLKELDEYIKSTYKKHYSGKYQATDMIIDAGHGTGFNIGNIMKLAKRYGKKDGYLKLDLFKLAHYAIIQMFVHDQEELESKKK